jgi:ParB family transcriptional regulator, chromosome partitioning protein
LGALLPSGDLELTVAGSPGGQTSSGARLLEIPISEIRPNSFQPRTVFDDEGIASLAASIRELGVLQPVLVRPAQDGSYELIAGERRWRAARRAGLSTIPAIVKSADDNGALEEALVENLHRIDLNALDEAAAYQQLVDDFHMTHDQIAQRVGKSRASITNTLRLFQLSPSIQRMILDGNLTPGHARALLGTDDKSFQEALARRAVTDGLSVRAVEEAVRLRTGGMAALSAEKVARQAEAKAKAERPAGLLELEEVLAEVLGTRVSIGLVPNQKGRLVVEFADLNDLERIFRIMTAVGVPDEPVLPTAATVLPTAATATATAATATAPTAPGERPAV